MTEATTETTTTETAPEAPTFDIPAGQYKGRGVEGSEQFGIGDKGDQVSVELVLADLGRTVTTILSFSDAAMPYSIDRLKMMGVPIGPDNAISTLAGLSKNEVPVLVKYEEYNGETKMKAEIISTRFSFKQPMSEPEKRDFFARVNSFAKNRATTAGVATPKGSPGAPPNGSYPENWDQPPPDPNRPAISL